MWIGLNWINTYRICFFAEMSETKVWGTAMTLCWNIYNQTSWIPWLYTDQMDMA